MLAASKYSRWHVLHSRQPSPRMYLSATTLRSAEPQRLHRSSSIPTTHLIYEVRD
jgi:hypothetical protein